MGYIYRQMGNLAQARESFQAAVNLRPRNIRALLGLGLVAQQLGDAELAVRSYSEAVAIQPSDVFYVLLSRALQQSGRARESQAAIEQGRRVSQDFAAAQRIASSLSAPSR
jgi:tetratricopeptide (TPR) repeat protein